MLQEIPDIFQILQAVQQFNVLYYKFRDMPMC